MLAKLKQFEHTLTFHALGILLLLHLELSGLLQLKLLHIGELLGRKLGVALLRLVWHLRLTLTGLALALGARLGDLVHVPWLIWLCVGLAGSRCWCLLRRLTCWLRLLASLLRLRGRLSCLCLIWGLPLLELWAGSLGRNLLLPLSHGCCDLRLLLLRRLLLLSRLLLLLLLSRRLLLLLLLLLGQVHCLLRHLPRMTRLSTMLRRLLILRNLVLMHGDLLCEELRLLRIDGLLSHLSIHQLRLMGVWRGWTNPCHVCICSHSSKLRRVHLTHLPHWHTVSSHVAVHG